MQTLVDLCGLQHPENLAFSPDGRVLAITNSRDGAVNLYRVDPDTHLVAAAPAASIRCAGDRNSHGLAFSPCSRFLVHTTVDDPGYVRVHRVVAGADGAVAAAPWQSTPNGLAPLKPKGIDFSPDGRFVAVCYAPNAAARGRRLAASLAIYPFDADRGIGVQPLARGDASLGLRNPEDVRYWPDGTHLVVTDQATDHAVIVGVDPDTGLLGRKRMTLANPEAQLSFPHGAGISSDGSYLAITSYGDDKFTVYALRPGTGDRGRTAPLRDGRSGAG